MSDPTIWTPLHEAPPKWGGDLAAAFAAAQADWPDITKGRTANVGQYKYTYADLSDVLASVRPVLARNGLFVTQNVVSRANAVDVWTTIGHKSGQSIDFGPMSFPAGNTPQTAGSAVTYARRYALLAALGLATEDDDGQAAAQAPKPKPAPKAQERQLNGTTGVVEGDASEAQTRAVFAALKERGFGERDAYLAELSRLIGRTISTSKELTRAEAGKVLDALNPKDSA